MNIQAELNWIQSELIKVKDPELILAFKNMLKYRNKKINSPLATTEFISDVQEATLQIEKGDYLSLEDFEKHADKWD